MRFIPQLSCGNEEEGSNTVETKETSEKETGLQKESITLKVKNINWTEDTHSKGSKALGRALSACNSRAQEHGWEG